MKTYPSFKMAFRPSIKGSSKIKTTRGILKYSDDHFLMYFFDDHANCLFSICDWTTFVHIIEFAGNGMTTYGGNPGFVFSNGVKIERQGHRILVKSVYQGRHYTLFINLNQQ